MASEDGFPSHPAAPVPGARLSAPELRRSCDPQALGFATTAELAPSSGRINQDRAAAAIEFALGVPGPGYNMLVTGAAGTGRRTTVETLLGEHAARRPAPADWVYLFNFDEPGRPIAARLPSGRARELAAAMDAFVEAAGQEIPRAFESDSYRERRNAAVADLEQHRQDVLARVRDDAARRHVAVELTPTGVVMVPLVDGHPVGPDELQRLPQATRDALNSAQHDIEEEIAELVRTFRQIDREAHERVRTLDREIALFAVGHLIDDVKARFAQTPAVEAWLERVREDVIDNLGRFTATMAPEAMATPQGGVALGGHGGERFLRRYGVNAFVAHEDGDGAPVVVETNLSYQDLFGRIEFESVFGAVATDHGHLSAGAIHRANGGYLVLRTLEVLSRPLVWSKLKEVLRTGRAQLENPAEQLMLFPTATLTPEPIDLDVKVVLVGTPDVHRLLYALDEDVRELFRVRVEFDVDVPWSDERVREYAGFVADRVRQHGLRHFDATAVARVVEHGARVAGDQRRLTTRLNGIAELVAEASHWAGSAGREVVTRADVEEAIARRIGRSNLVEERIDELIADGTLMIAVDGERVGQVNGLSVIELGDYAFGRPTRITATTAAGRGDVLSIDRETELSGAVHDKGFLTLRGYLEQRYGGRVPLTLSASVTFEQSYAGVEGDSAASAELYALLSSLAGMPLRQSIAVTGSVNQYGDVQAIGAVNEKIEGFYAVCSRSGLSGDQGVIIPRSNVHHLMLRDEVIEAVSAGRFHIWAVATIDEGLELLTGVPAGERGADGEFPEETVHRAVEERLRALAETARGMQEAAS
ncbi:MAG TPA: AAA family ATPase [Solirubrobacteraceae bacterium]